MSEATAVATSSPSMPWRSLMPWGISLAVMAVLPFLFEGGTAFTLMNVIGINIQEKNCKFFCHFGHNGHSKCPKIAILVKFQN